MNRSRCILIGIAALLLNFSAHGAGFTLQNLNEGDFKNVISDISANFNHTSVSGASPLGDIFGIEVGLVAGMAKSPELDKYAKRADANAKDIDQIPHAELLGVISVPLAFTFEAGLIPKVGSKDFKFSSYSLAAKWTPSELFFDWPVSVAAKVHYTQTDLTVKNEVNNVDTTMDFKNGMTGATLLVSKGFAVFEPYFGIGIVNADAKLSATGSAAFNPAYTASNSASEKVSTTAWMVGAEAKLLVVRFGLEYSNLFDTDRFTGKFSFYF